MLSAPPATAASVSPSRMYCAAETIACMPLPHRRFTVSAPVSCGSPPLTQATREMYMSFGSVWITLPNTHWPTSFGSTLARADRFLDDARGEFGRRDVLQAAAVVADGRAHTAQDDDFSLLAHGASPRNGEVNYPSIRVFAHGWVCPGSTNQAWETRRQILGALRHSFTNDTNAVRLGGCCRRPG